MQLTCIVLLLASWACANATPIPTVAADADERSGSGKG